MTTAAASQLAEALAEVHKQPHKFRARAVTIDGHRFPSQAEATRYAELKMLERAGEISSLVLQPVFPMVVNGHKICEYRADFSYLARGAHHSTVEDVKSEPTKTAEYRLKAKLLFACHGILIAEVGGGRR